MSYAFTAQSISLLLSIFISLVLPKILSIEEYSYWQLFLFYVSYVSLFQFGLNDGIYLTNGGKELSKINKVEIGSQFKVLIAFNTVVAMAVLILSITLFDNSADQLVLILAALYLPFYNTNGFLGGLFQAVNKTKVYSISTIIEKLVFFIISIFLIVYEVREFYFFIIAYTIGKIISILFISFKAREIIFSKMDSLNKTFSLVFVNIRIGINLMFSNLLGSLILGVGRFVIINIWGLIQFGKISFSLSLSNFFLMFVAQVSMVLFPALHRVNQDNLSKYYQVFRELLDIVLLGALLAYLPISIFIPLWLPQYQSSVHYLAILLPIIIFDGKMSILYSTYLKVLRQEKLLLKINILALSISVILSSVSGYIFNSFYAVVISMVISVAVRSLISDVALARLLLISFDKKYVVENLSLVIMIIIFVSTTLFIPPNINFFIYPITYFIYLFIHRRGIRKIIYSINKYVIKR
jgi:O-antigen/teichoic acid export membrane protein